MVEIKKLPPGEAEGARDLQGWASNRLAGRSGGDLDKQFQARVEGWRQKRQAMEARRQASSAGSETWLVRRGGKKAAAHVWNGTDTACRMASTGGLKVSRYEVVQDRGDREVCTMCRAVSPGGR